MFVKGKKRIKEYLENPHTYTWNRVFTIPNSMSFDIENKLPWMYNFYKLYHILPKDCSMIELELSIGSNNSN